jgi:hypothetical protein
MFEKKSMAMHYHLTTSRCWSYDVTLHISLTVQSNVRQLNILTNGIAALGVYAVLIPKYLVGSSLIGRRKMLTLSWRKGKKCQLDLECMVMKDYCYRPSVMMAIVLPKSDPGRELDHRSNQ